MNLQNMMKTTLISILLTLTLSSCGTSEVQTDSAGIGSSKDYERIQTALTYKNLATLDLDQMNDLLQVKINDYGQQNNIQSLREAAMIVFSRPDDDAMVEKIVSAVRNPLEEEGQWSSTIESLVRQSVETLKNSEAPQADQVTAGIILENILSEFKPLFIRQYKTGGFETDIVNSIAAADVEYSKGASKERGLYLMRNNLNPSQIAKKLVANKESQNKKK